MPSYHIKALTETQSTNYIYKKSCDSFIIGNMMHGNKKTFILSRLVIHWPTADMSGELVISNSPLSLSAVTPSRSLQTHDFDQLFYFTLPFSHLYALRLTSDL